MLVVGFGVLLSACRHTPTSALLWVKLLMFPIAIFTYASGLLLKEEATCFHGMTSI